MAKRKYKLNSLPLKQIKMEISICWITWFQFSVLCLRQRCRKFNSCFLIVDNGFRKMYTKTDNIIVITKVILIYFVKQLSFQNWRMNILRKQSFVTSSCKSCSCYAAAKHWKLRGQVEEVLSFCNWWYVRVCIRKSQRKMWQRKFWTNSRPALWMLEVC